MEKSPAEREREAERERDRHSPFSQRHLHTHHHTHVGMGYPLIPGQYDPFQGEQKIFSGWDWLASWNCCLDIGNRAHMKHFE